MPTAPERSTRDIAQALSPRWRSLAFGVLTIAFVMEIVDTTIVNIGIPAIERSLGAHTTQVQWIVAVYPATLALLLIVGGRLGDAFGYRRMFIGGIIGFAIASGLCGAAATSPELIAARAIQGVASAMMGPQVMALIQILYRPHERVKMLSVFGLLGGLAAVLGPILGGSLIDANLLGLGWRPIFLINVPIGMAGAIAGLALLPGGRSPHRLMADFRGLAMLTLSLLTLLFPLIDGRTLGWPLWCIGLLLISTVFLLLFARHVARLGRAGRAALVPAALFTDRGFTVGLIEQLLISVSTGGFLLVLTLGLQQGLRFNPLRAALTHVPFAVGISFGISVLGRRLLPKLGRRVLSIGAVVAACGVALLIGAMEYRSTGPWLGGALLISGAGLGMVMGPLSPITLAAVDVGHAGAAAGVLNSVQQLGGAIGVAVLGAVYFLAVSARPGVEGILAGFAHSAVAIGVLLLIAAATAELLPKRLLTDAVHNRPVIGT